MRLLAAVALDTDSEAIATELLGLGALEMVSMRDLSGDWQSKLAQVEPKVNQARLVELRKRVEGFMGMASPPIARPFLGGPSPTMTSSGGMSLAAAIPGSSLMPGAAAMQGPAAAGLPDLSIARADLDAAEKRLDAVAAEINGLRERQKDIQDEILKLDEIHRQIEAFGDLKAGAAAGSSYSFLSIRAGMLPAERFDDLNLALEGIPSVILPSSGDNASTGVKALVLVSLRKDNARVEPVLERLGWQEAKLPDSSGEGKEKALASLSTKVEALKARQAACSDELGDYFKVNGDGLARLWAELRVEELVSRVRSSFSRTERTVLFSGWIPVEKTAVVEAGIRKAAAGGCGIEWMDPGEGEASTVKAPVEMKNPAFLKPFEGLVKNYATPEYGSVDPTPFVAVAYLIMFGLMFGDAGHGLVVALVGVAGILLARKAGKPLGLFPLFVYCGSAAIVAGILFGSYFGMELLPPLWFDYHGVVNGHEVEGGIRSVYDILGITIRFGMAVLAAGFAINWINLARKREWFTLILDKAGLLGGWIYGAGAWVAFYYVRHNYRELPSTNTLVLLLGLPTLVLAFKAPIEFVLHGRHGGKCFKPAKIIDFFMEWIVEILEIYSGYLANTLSFMRVAGLGIAHVSLMTAFFQIARMISPEGPFSLPALAVLVAGNILVIALEGLSAGIQSLRLNYYEFFSKYFNGTGRAYRPISFNGAE
jgi:V/A-type H+-transporting ATPase subunit I